MNNITTAENIIVFPNGMTVTIRIQGAIDNDLFDKLKKIVDEKYSERYQDEHA